MDDIVVELVRTLGTSKDIGFNVFDVMHHGLHEKQLSNVFRWLLDEQGTHGMSGRFQQIFVSALAARSPEFGSLPTSGYSVRQEVNVAEVPAVDIADLVLQAGSARIVVENYHISDGHGHAFEHYQAFAHAAGGLGAVVLLCQEEDRNRQILGWESATVLTYEGLVGELHSQLRSDAKYRRENAEAFAFIDQMHRKFGKRDEVVTDQDNVDFVVAMCTTGEASRYQRRPLEVAAEQFAGDFAVQARDRFMGGYDSLQQVKRRLSVFAQSVIVPQLNEALGASVVSGASARYQGIYQWTINFSVEGLPGAGGEGGLQLKFGPSAWMSLMSDRDWENAEKPLEPDFHYVFATRPVQRIRQTPVTIQDVIDGLPSDDRRLADELLLLIRGS